MKTGRSCLVRFAVTGVFGAAKSGAEGDWAGRGEVTDVSAPLLGVWVEKGPDPATSEANSGTVEEGGPGGGGKDVAGDWKDS